MSCDSLFMASREKYPQLSLLSVTSFHTSPFSHVTVWHIVAKHLIGAVVLPLRDWLIGVVIHVDTCAHVLGMHGTVRRDRVLAGST